MGTDDDCPEKRSVCIPATIDLFAEGNGVILEGISFGYEKSRVA
jgi:hypothetical protein